jgi:hypothetical protein
MIWLARIGKFLWSYRNAILIVVGITASGCFSAKVAKDQFVSTINELDWLFILIVILIILVKLIDLAKFYLNRSS